MYHGYGRWRCEKPHMLRPHLEKSVLTEGLAYVLESETRFLINNIIFGLPGVADPPLLYSPPPPTTSSSLYSSI